MRQLVVLMVVALSTACTSTLAEPSLMVSPYLAIYELRGNASLQSEGANPGDPLVNNPPQEMRTFGHDRFREDVGVRADLGDGFAGIRLDYYRLDMNTARTGMLEADWGRLLQDDEVSIRAEMDDIRLGLLEPIFDASTQYRDEPLRFQFAAGGIFQHRRMKLRGKTADGMRSQNVEIEGDLAYVAVRGRAEWQQIALDLDYAICPELVLSGDYEDVQQDFEVRLSYKLPQRDIRVFGGYRYSEMPAKGDANGFAYASDLVVNGFQLGLLVTF